MRLARLLGALAGTLKADLPARRDRMKVLVVGPCGGLNLGDDLIPETVVGALRAVRDVDAVVFGGGQQIHQSRFGIPFWGTLTTCAIFIREAARQRKPTYFWGDPVLAQLRSEAELSRTLVAELVGRRSWQPELAHLPVQHRTAVPPSSLARDSSKAWLHYRVHAHALEMRHPVMDQAISTN